MRTLNIKDTTLANHPLGWGALVGVGFADYQPIGLKNGEFLEMASVRHSNVCTVITWTASRSGRIFRINIWGDHFIKDADYSTMYMQEVDL